MARRYNRSDNSRLCGGIESKHQRTNKFLQEWWRHRLNNLPSRCTEWCDEMTRSGELFIVLTTDLSGMSYVRAIPAADIQEIETADNDLEQEINIYEKPSLDDQNKTLNDLIQLDYLWMSNYLQNMYLSSYSL